jgi:hypothetical protein
MDHGGITSQELGTQDAEGERSRSSESENALMMIWSTKMSTLRAYACRVNFICAKHAFCDCVDAVGEGRHRQWWPRRTRWVIEWTLYLLYVRVKPKAIRGCTIKWISIYMLYVYVICIHVGLWDGLNWEPSSSNVKRTRAHFRHCV